LQFHYKVHTSIDIIEEKLNIGNKTTVDIRDLYLGLLFATEEYKMYEISHIYIMALADTNHVLNIS